MSPPLKSLFAKSARHLARESAGAKDLGNVVIAADVFVYLGKLDELVKELQRLLRPGGLFAFSVEALEAIVDNAENGAQDLAYRLNSTGRYVHSLPYLRKIAADGGFELLDIKPTEGRRNEGKPVQAYLTLLRRP